MAKGRTSTPCAQCQAHWKPRWLLDGLCPCCRSTQVAAGERTPHSNRPSKKRKQPPKIHLRAHWGDHGTSLTFCDNVLPDAVCSQTKDGITCIDCWDGFHKLFPPKPFDKL